MPPAPESQQARIALFGLVDGAPDVPGVVQGADRWYSVELPGSFVHLYERWRDASTIVCDVVGFIPRVNAMQTHASQWATPAQAAGGGPPAWLHVGDWAEVPLRATVCGFEHDVIWENET